MERAPAPETVRITHPDAKSRLPTVETCSQLQRKANSIMRKHFAMPLIFAAIAAGLLMPIPGVSRFEASAAQAGARTSDGKPDFSGVWSWPVTVNPTGPRGTGIFNKDKMAPVKPGAESLLYQPRTGDARIDEPRSACLPSGFPSGMLYEIGRASCRERV